MCAFKTFRGRSWNESKRTGISLIELLTSLGIISLLMALLLPAIQAAREAARKSTCVSRLHQIGIALHAFESSHGRYPAGAPRSVTATGNLSTYNLAPQVELLPYLDRQDLFDQFDRAELGSGIDADPPTSTVNSSLLLAEIVALTCPSDSLGGPRCNYRISSGTSPWMHETVPKSPQAALQGYRSLFGRKDREFADGKANTTAFSEKLVGDRNPGHYTPERDLASIESNGVSLRTPDDALKACSNPMDRKPKHFSFGGTTWGLSGYPQTWYNHVLTPNSSIPDCVDGGPMGHGAFTARALHPGGVSVLFADGSVRVISDSVDLDVWRALGSVAGNEIVSE